MDKLNPDALAESGDPELDDRENVQPVTEMMLYEHVFITLNALPVHSARPFAEWLHECWNDWNEDGTHTNGEVIAGALAYWRGEA